MLAYAQVGLSIVAQSKSNNRYAAVACNLDFGYLLNYNRNEDNCPSLPIMTDVMHMVHELEKNVQLKYFPDIKLNQVFHIDLLGVHPDFAGQGLGTSLFKLCYDHAVKLNYSAMVVSASNNRTTHIAVDKFKFTKLPEELSYSTWVTQHGVLSF